MAWGYHSRSHLAAKLFTLHFTTRGLMATGGLTLEGAGNGEEKGELELGS